MCHCSSEAIVFKRLFLVDMDILVKLRGVLANSEPLRCRFSLLGRSAIGHGAESHRGLRRIHAVLCLLQLSYVL